MQKVPKLLIRGKDALSKVRLMIGRLRGTVTHCVPHGDDEFIVTVEDVDPQELEGVYRDHPEVMLQAA